MEMVREWAWRALVSVTCACQFLFAGHGLEGRIERVENGLLPATSIDGAPWNIADRMRHYRVAGVSVAVIHNYEIDWAKGYGVLDAGSDTPVSADTLFQAASISKPFAAAGVLSLVQQGRITLDDEANRKLTSWQIPGNALTAMQPVTLRHLLSHTAGTSIVGYVGYTPSQGLPTLVQILNGQRPWSNSPPVVVDQMPGSKYRYSGGGYTVLQQLAMDLTGIPFADWMRMELLDKLELSRSTFEQPLPTNLWENAASGHFADGGPIPWKAMIHPELAAAGLWTSAPEVARFVIELQKAYAGKSERILTKSMVRQMLSPQPAAPNWGLGLELQAEGTVFLHTGHNQGYRNILIGFPHTGDGAIVMTNSDAETDLRMEILRAIATEYGWPLVRVTGYPAQAPTLVSAVNAGSQRSEIAPDTVVFLRGENLSGITEVLFNGVRGVLVSTSEQEAVAVTPKEIEFGPALVQVGRAAVRSSGKLVRVAAYAPGILSIVHGSKPIHRGETMTLVCTGLGSGDDEPSVTVGEARARVLRIRPLEEMPGAVQVDIEVPADSSAGSSIPVQIRIGNATSNVVTMAVA